MNNHTERGLFERIKECIDMHNCCNFPQPIEKICAEFEQQLADAERDKSQALWALTQSEARYHELDQRLMQANAKLQDFSRSADTIWCQQERKINQLDIVVAAAKAVNEHWNEFGAEYGLGERMDNLHNALTAAPQQGEKG
jgi:hypothetical protein